MAMYRNSVPPPKQMVFLPPAPIKGIPIKSVLDHMKIATINVPDAYLDDMEVLVKQGFYPSRSEVVREALKQFLTREYFINDNLSKETFAAMKQKQMDHMIH